jgi:hypothetical protein
VLEAVHRLPGAQAAAAVTQAQARAAGSGG